MTDLPMTMYSCKLKNSWFCKYKGNLPTGASDFYGSRFCNVPNSTVERLATNCDQIEVEETQIVAKVTKDGMIT
ncbi:MAG: hypothetical protein WC827_05045 [Candidatus Paceibacterota bacterium]